MRDTHEPSEKITRPEAEIRLRLERGLEVRRGEVGADDCTPEVRADAAYLDRVSAGALDPCIRPEFMPDGVRGIFGGAL